MAKDLGLGLTFWELIESLLKNECLKSISVSCARDRTLSATFSIMGDVNTVLEGLKNANVFISQVNKGSTTTNVTVVDKSSSITNLKITKSAIFKSVYKGALELHESGIIPTEIVSPLELPEADVYIKECTSPYEDDGWTVSEIFARLGLTVRFPAGWNYHVTQLVATAGTPVINLVQNLIPVPGLSIRVLGSLVIVSSPFGFYVDPTACNVVAVAYDETQIYLTVSGGPGEVRYVRGGSHTKFKQEDNISYILNRIGGIFGVSHTEIKDAMKQVATSVWSKKV